MKLSNSQERNINCIALYCLDERDKKYDIINSFESNNQIQISFIRKISINKLEEINSYLCSNIRNKRLIYKFIITPTSCEIMLDQPEFKQLSLFNDTYDVDRLKKYNQSINLKLLNIKNLLINTFFDTDNVECDWIYFFVAPSYIGYGNGNTESKCCIRGTTEIIPENVYTIHGTYNDAKCVLLRRNQNSACYGNWNTVPNDIKYVKEFVNSIYKFV